MQAEDLIVRVRRLDGQWEQLAVGQDVGVVPESVDLSANPKGPDRATFTLNRRPDQPRLDLAHDTPIEIEVGGMVVWDGRLVEAPAGESITVTAEGWQYALDDFTYTAPYVHHDLSDWKDLRSVLTANLAVLKSYFTVNQEDGAITIMVPKGSVVAAGDYGGVVLDAGPDAYWLRAGIEYETNNNNLGGTPTLYIRGHTRPDDTAWTGDDIVSGDALTTMGAKGVRAGMLPSGQTNPFIAKRYLLVFVYINAGATTTGDQWVKIKAARASGYGSTGTNSGPSNYLITGPVTTDPEPAGGYVMAAKSRLRPDHVITDAFGRVSQLSSPGTYESASFRDEVLGTDGLYAYYRFQEAAGATVAVDSSGNKRNATITGSPTLAQPRLLAADPADPDPAGGANTIYLTSPAFGSRDHVDVPTLDISETGITVEVVFSVDGLGGYQNILSIGSANTAGQNLSLLVVAASDGTNPNKLLWGSEGAGGQVVVPFTSPYSSLVAGRTYYAMAAYHPSLVLALAIYDTTTPANVTPLTRVGSTPFAWAGGTTPPIQIGNWTALGGSRGFVGRIDELALYQQYLAPAEGSLLGGGGWPSVETRRRALAALKREVGDIKRSGFSIGVYNHVARSPREAIDAANAFNGYQPQVLPGRTWRHRALPATPLAKIGDWPGATFEDASNMSGRDVINSARVTGTDPAGNPIISVYTTADLPDAILSTGPAPQPSNPSFDANANNWAVDNGGGGVGFVVRDTGVFDTAPASLSITNNTAGTYTQGVYTQTFTGPFQPGRAYYLSLALKGGASLGGTQVSAIRILDKATGQTVLSESGPSLTAGGAWQRYTSGRFLPRSSALVIIVTCSNGGVANGQPIFYLDTVKVLTSAYTVLDRQGGFREKVMQASQPVTQQIADQLAKLLLLTSMTTPFKGGANIDDNGMRGYRDDRGISAVEALLMAGELLHVAHVSEPDKGGLGRDGRIVNVGWNYGTRKARIDLDNTRGAFDALLARYGVRVT